MESILMSVKATSEYLSVPRSAVYVLVKQPNFPCIKIGRHIMVNKKHLDIYCSTFTGC